MIKFTNASNADIMFILRAHDYKNHKRVVHLKKNSSLIFRKQELEEHKHLCFLYGELVKDSQYIRLIKRRCIFAENIAN